MKLLNSTLFLFFIFNVAYSQDTRPFEEKMYDPSINFYDVCKEAEAHFDTIDITEKGNGWKHYQRWKSANEYKYYPSGDRSQVDPAFALKQYQLFKNTNPKQLFPNGWKDLGPYTIDSITGHYSAGLGRVEDFYVDPSNSMIIYQGSRSGGFWKSTNGGITWSGGVSDFLPASGVNAITASPTNSDSVLINSRNAQNGYSHGIYRSTDGGDTWNLTPFNAANLGFGGLASNFAIFEIVHHPRVPNLIFVGTNKGIFRSDDNLQTWTQLYSSADVKEITFHPTNDNIVYFYDSYYWGTTHDQIYRSVDQGISYTLSNTIVGNNGNRSVKIDVTPECDHCVYVASNNGIWISTDEGVSFTFRNDPGQNSDGFAVNDLDSSSMIIGAIDLERTTNGGQAWNQVTYWSLGNTNGAGNGHQISYNTSTDYVHADLRNARCINGVFYVATDGFLSKSTDNGITWEIIGKGVGIRENYCLGLSQSNYFVSMSGSQDNGTSIKVKDQWIEFYGADGMEAIIHPLNEDWMIGSLQNGGRRKTIDGGKNQSGATPPGSFSGHWIAPLAYDPNEHHRVYDFRETIYRSEDFGETWTELGSPASFTGTIMHASVAQNNSDIIVITRNEFIDKSTDGGLTFTSIKNNLPNYTIEDIAFDPNDDDVLVVVYGKYQNDNSKVFITTNGGATWSNITTNIGNMPIRSVVIDHTPESNIYLGAEIGVYTKPMNGIGWSLYNTDLPNVAVRDLEINYGANSIKAATWGRGLWEYTLVNRVDYPAVITTDLTSNVTLNSPKEGIDQYVTSTIHYDNALSSVYTEWSVGAPTFGNSISMSNVSDSTWTTDSPIPNQAVGSKVFFRVVAVGSNGDTTHTYKFMYTVHPAEYCSATGNDNDGNLYIQQVQLSTINNVSGNDYYSYYSTPVELYADSTYTIAVNGNTGWSDNDYAVWIDFNGDLDFTPDENVLWSISPGALAQSTFTVPSSVYELDTVRMRVRLSYWGSNPLVCGDQFGEVEDYAVLLTQVSAGINSIEQESLVLYPNPSSGLINVQFEGQLDEVKLFDLLGREIKVSFESNQIDASMLQAGEYIVRLRSGETEFIRQILIVD